MTESNGGDQSGSSPLRAVPAWLSALLLAPPIVLCASALTGLGLAREVGGAAALAAAFCLSVLPILGLLSLARGRTPLVTLLTAWLWCLLVLVCIPLYFPGERAQATASGLRLLTTPLGPALGERVAAGGARMVTALGGDRDLLPAAVPMEALAEGELESDPEPYASRAMEGAAAEEVPEPNAVEAPVLVPYEPQNGSLQIAVDVDGPEAGEQLQMIFDTGATYTTLSQHALELLDIPVPPGAPRITLRTANGEIEAPLVLVDAIWLGDAAVEWVTVAVCDSCASAQTAGLLGLNVSGQFVVAIDHDRNRIELRPRRRYRNRRLDVRQWIDVRSTATVWWDGGVEVALDARNLSRREIRGAVVQLDCGGDSFAVQLDDIAAHGETSTRVALPRGTDCRRQTLELVRANWRLDRF
jgi:predicted aspartyl protease